MNNIADPDHPVNLNGSHNLKNPGRMSNSVGMSVEP